MPLLSQIPSYANWEPEIKRMLCILYNHPISDRLGYVIKNLREFGARKDVDKRAIDHLRSKLGAKLALRG